MSIIGIIIGFIVFIIGCTYAVGEFGFFLGLGLGWIPAFFIGFFVGILVDLIITTIIIAFALAPMRKMYLSDLSGRHVVEQDVSRRPPQIPLEEHVRREGPKLAWTYVLWFVLGLFGGHRYYLQRIDSGTLQLVLGLASVYVLATMDLRNLGSTESSLFIPVVALIWLLSDLFQIPTMISEKRAELRLRIRARMAPTEG